jgi:hypothetical protein
MDDYFAHTFVIFDVLELQGMSEAKVEKIKEASQKILVRRATSWRCLVV